jgi:RND family efflux transporter MFP subunit
VGVLTGLLKPQAINMTAIKKCFGAGILAAILVLFGWQLIFKIVTSHKDADRRPAHRPVAVEVAAVQQSAIHDTGVFTGSLLPTSRFVLAPKIAGRLEKILVNIGDEVKPGQLVAVLDDEEYRQQVSQAGAELEVTRAALEEVRGTLETSRREFERTVELRKRKIASESQLDAAESDYNALRARLRLALAQVEQKEAALRIAEVRLRYTRIEVPEGNGGIRVVGERFVDEGALLAPNTPIVSVLDITRLNAVIHVIERDYAKIKPGLEAIISTDAFPRETFSGRVSRIAPLLKERSRQARVEIEIFNESMQLKPGMFVRTQIQYAVREKATVVPVSALVTRNGAQGVFLADRQSHTARFVPVTLGITTRDRAEVLDPPLTGDVVTLGIHLVVDGAPITIPEPREQAASLGEQT